MQINDWLVVETYMLQLAILPIQQTFGLIFRERFFSLGITATQTSLIVHLNGTITCSLGLISGPMMKRFTFRKVAFLGGFIVIVGICAAAYAISLPSIILTYCIIVGESNRWMCLFVFFQFFFPILVEEIDFSQEREKERIEICDKKVENQFLGIGHGIMFPATNLAMNTYFRKKRNIAMGLSVTLTGLGPILMPLLIAKLLENYATTGTLLILSAVSMHSLIGASLLKPFEEKQVSLIVFSNVFSFFFHAITFLDVFSSLYLSIYRENTS